MSNWLELALRAMEQEGGALGGAMKAPTHNDTPPAGGWDRAPDVATPPINPNDPYGNQPKKGDPGDPYGGRGAGMSDLDVMRALNAGPLSAQLTGGAPVGQETRGFNSDGSLAPTPPEARAPQGDSVEEIERQIAELENAAANYGWLPGLDPELDAMYDIPPHIAAVIDTIPKQRLQDAAIERMFLSPINRSTQGHIAAYEGEVLGKRKAELYKKRDQLLEQQNASRPALLAKFQSEVLANLPPVLAAPKVPDYIPSLGEMGLPSVEDLGPVHAALLDQVSGKATEEKAVQKYVVNPEYLGKTLDEIYAIDDMEAASVFAERQAGQASEAVPSAADMIAQAMTAAAANPEYESITAGEIKAMLEDPESLARMQSAEAQAAVARETMRRNHENRVNNVLALLDKYPKLPEMPGYEMPSSAQMIVAGLGAIMAPEFAFDILATPFNESKRRREETYGLAMKQYEADRDRFGLGFQVQQMIDEDERALDALDYQEAKGVAESARSAYEKGQEQRRAAVIQAFDRQAQHQYRMIEQQAANQFRSYEAIQLSKRQAAQAYAARGMQMYTDPSLSPEMREIGRLMAEKFSADLGNPMSLQPADKTTPEYLGRIAEANTKVWGEKSAQLRYESDAKFLNDERAAGLHGRQLGNLGQELENEGKALSNQLTQKRIAWFDEEQQASLDATRSRIESAKKSGEAALRTEATQALEFQVKKYQGLKEGLIGEAKAIRDNPILKFEPEKMEAALAPIRQKIADLDGLIGELRDKQTGLLYLGEDLVGKINYKWGGKDLQRDGGVDCSGYNCLIAKKNGVTIPAGSADQFKVLPKVAAAEVEEGDLVYFDSSASPSGWHTGVIFFKPGSHEAWVRHASGNKPGTEDDVKEETLRAMEKRMPVKGYRRWRNYRAK